MPCPSRIALGSPTVSLRVDLPKTWNHGFRLPTGWISGVRESERETLTQNERKKDNST